MSKAKLHTLDDEKVTEIINFKKMVERSFEGYRCNWHITGNIHHNPGGVFYGISMETNEPLFGGGRVINAAWFRNRNHNEMLEICSKLMKDYPNCIARPRPCK